MNRCLSRQSYTTRHQSSHDPAQAASAGRWRSNLTNDACRRAHHNHSAMHRHVSHAGGWKKIDHHPHRSQDDHIRRAHAGRHGSYSRGRKEVDEHRRCARGQDRTAHMRHNASHHWTDVHVGHSGCWRHRHFSTISVNLLIPHCRLVCPFCSNMQALHKCLVVRSYCPQLSFQRRQGNNAQPKAQSHISLGMQHAPG